MTMGSYNVRRSEAKNLSEGEKEKEKSIITCSVTFLDASTSSFNVEKNAKGSVLLEKVFKHLELVEEDFFGLQFVAVLNTTDAQQKIWLDSSKSIRKQMMCPPYQLNFRVKFYVNGPSKLRDEYTRYLLFLQVRLDMQEGRLPCNDGSLALLASYAVQSDLGDFNEEEHAAGYGENLNFAPTQPEDFSPRIAELHRLHIGQCPSEAEFNFLDHARRLEMYGVETFNAMDGKGLPILIGVSSFGAKIFHEGEKINEFSWSQIMKLSFRKKQFYLQVKTEDPPEETVFIFNVVTPITCKLLWKCCIENHTFFRLKSPPSAPPRKIFNVGSRFRYSGRTEFQTIEDQQHKKPLIQRNFYRSTSRASRHLDPSSSLDSSRYTTTTGSPEAQPRSSTLLARRILAASRRETDASTASEPVMNGSSCDFYNTDSETSAPSRRFEEEHPSEKSWTMQACTSSSTLHHHRPQSSIGAPRRGPPPTTNGFTNGLPPAASLHTAYINGNGTLSRATLSQSRGSPRISAAAIFSQPNNSSPRNSIASYSSYASAGIGGSPPRSRRSPHSQKSNSPVGEDSLVCVKMRPDVHGRFGFNVKGGADQNYPVIVSRVAAGSSADKCQPRLNEGDQVLFINGRDVSNMSHDQVVAFIRSARVNPTGGELVLTIKPNVYRLGEEVDEPDTSCVPETTRVADSVPRSDKLSQSLRLLGDSLTSGKIMSQFEQLYRKKPGLSMNDCRLSINASKNRYRDVCPYDATRVYLTSSPSGDYINANYVNMEIPSSGIVNRYIACQGPLAHTSADFWTMVWEQHCATIVMLTTLTERGRVKCHQYWPRMYETQDYGRLLVKCIKDRQTANCSYREFSVKDRSTNEERRVSQMQYTAWPDHGVPDDPQHFISFVDEVRKARAGSVDPIVVHCSAGIGRTGVLILMETASCLVEANEPVYPLDIVRIMRDQRAMLIQTPGQYQFVCESILQAYENGTIRPMAEYQKRS